MIEAPGKINKILNLLTELKEESKVKKDITMLLIARGIEKHIIDLLKENGIGNTKNEM